MANKSQTTVLYQDASGTFGAAAVTVLAQDPGRQYVLISNPGNAVFYLNFNGTASAGAGSHPIAPNGSYAPGGGTVPGNALSLFGTNGQPYTVTYLPG